MVNTGQYINFLLPMTLPVRNKKENQGSSCKLLSRDGISSFFLRFYSFWAGKAEEFWRIRWGLNEQNWKKRQWTSWEKVEVNSDNNWIRKSSHFLRFVSAGDLFLAQYSMHSKNDQQLHQGYLFCWLLWACWGISLSTQLWAHQHHDDKRLLC